MTKRKNKVDQDYEVFLSWYEKNYSNFQSDNKAACLATIERAINEGVLIMGKSEPFDRWCDGLED